MISKTTKRFREALAELPKEIQRQARQSYKLFKQDPRHPSLQFKKVHATKPVYSARISLDYRALGSLNGDEMIWFWIGSHAAYTRLLAQL